MPHSAYIRICDKARSLLRDEQLTIDELTDRLAVSRSTIYSWVGDMPIPRAGVDYEAHGQVERRG